MILWYFVNGSVVNNRYLCCLFFFGEDNWCGICFSFFGFFNSLDVLIFLKKKIKCWNIFINKL